MITLPAKKLQAYCMSKPLHVVVIGAGFCGLSSAIWLRRAGHKVTLIDKDGPGAGASFGNAGLLAQWAIIPVNTPGLARTGLKYLLNPKQPLFVQWSYLPRMVPWLLKFLSHANEDGSRAMIEALAPLVSDSVAQHENLVRNTSAASFITTSDFSFAYGTRADFEKEAYGWRLREEFGFVPELIEGHAVHEAEPICGPNIQCLAVLKGHGHVLNPGGYCDALAQVLREEGGSIRQAEAKDFELIDGKIRAVVTDHGTLSCDHAVLGAGIWSKELTRKLGLRVPLETERGYHLHLINPSQMPRNPMMMVKGKFGVNPMTTGLRCAGTVELGNHTSGPSKTPLELIRRNVTWAFPELEYDTAEEWMGFRPSTPDSLPLVGEIRNTGIYANFGHQHVGLTAGPKTSRWIADLMSGKQPNIDLTPYDPNRF